MLEELKLMLGAAAANFSEPQLNLAIKQAIAEVEDYCRRDLDATLEICALKIAKIKLTRMDSDGLVSQSFSGVNESYIDGYPADVLTILNRKRKIKVI